MGKKIFVSYKYSDSLVAKLPDIFLTTARNYVDAFQKKIASTDHIYKGEDDGESLETLADSSISSKLGDKIFDSSITVVFISRGMKDGNPEKDQWIPWEISYSLHEQSREGKTSKTNAILAVVLPDQFNSYQYYFQDNPGCNSTTHMTNILFKIMRENMFNIKSADTRQCNGTTIYSGYFSYIYCAKWDEFILDIDKYINIALEICTNKENYNLCKLV